MSRLQSNPDDQFVIEHADSNCEHKFQLRDERPVGVSKESRQEALRKFDLEAHSEKPAKTSPTKSGSGDLAELLTNAKVLLENKEFKLSEDLYQHALQLEPENEIALRGLGLAALGRGDHEAALAAFNRYLEFQQEAEVYFQVAHIYYELGNEDESYVNYQAGVPLVERETESLFEAYKNMGNICVRRQEFSVAEEYYNKAYSMNPDSDVLLVNFGTLEIQRGKMDMALKRFRAAVELNQQSDKAWIGLAVIHREYGDHDLAWGNIERALDIQFDNITALKLALEWSFRDGRWTTMISRIETYLEGHRNDVELRLMLAKLLIGASRNKQAKAEVLTVLEMDTENEEAIKILTYLDSANA